VYSPFAKSSRNETSIALASSGFRGGNGAAACYEIKVLLDMPVLASIHGSFDQAPKIRHLAMK